jgi:hypothetical protein
VLPRALKKSTTNTRLIAELERDGHDTTDAMNRVIEFLEAQELHLHDRDLLRAELEEFRD